MADFDHSDRTSRHYDPLLGPCVCEHCQKLPWLAEAAQAEQRPVLDLEPPTMGRHNANIEASIQRIQRGNTYRDLSTIWIVPTRGLMHTRVVSSWLSVVKPMNQKFIGPLFLEGDEVGIAYSKGFEEILKHPELRNYQYILTVEEDNMPPADGVMQLYESIDKGYDCVGGLYWTKGEGGQAMIYGDPHVMPRNFIPQAPRPNSLQWCNGLGMGFNLWSMKSLREKIADKMEKPWFRTLNETQRSFTQDLYFFNEAPKFGFRVACDTRVRVGHHDARTDIIW